MTDFARRLTDPLEKEAPGTNGHRATKANQQDHPNPTRVARKELPAAIGIPIAWPRGDDPMVKAKRRQLRDEWMEGVHEKVTDDIIALRLLWPIFSSIFLDGSGVSKRSNEWFAQKVRRSVSVVQRGLRRLSNAGWIVIEEELRHDAEGRPYTLRKIRLAFPDSASANAASEAERESVAEKTDEEWQAEAD